MAVASDSNGSPKLIKKLLVLVSLSLGVLLFLLFWVSGGKVIQPRVSITGRKHERQRVLETQESIAKKQSRTLRGSMYPEGKPFLDWINSGEIPGSQIPLERGVHYDSDYDLTDLYRPDNTRFTEKSRYRLPDPTKFEYRVVSWNPIVLYFPRFISDAEADHLIERARGQMHRSEVAIYKDTKGESVQDVRTSEQTWLSPNTPMHQEVEARIKEAINNPAATSELMQILKYQYNQKYSAHNDYFDPALYGKQSTQRYATFFLYLSNVTEGGETFFPRANHAREGMEVSDFDDCTPGVRIHPIKGAATLFYDMLPDGTLDPYSLHGGCPVGTHTQTKFAGTKWWRLRV